MSGPADIQRFPTALATATAPGAMPAALAGAIAADVTKSLGAGVTPGGAILNLGSTLYDEHIRLHGGTDGVTMPAPVDICYSSATWSGVVNPIWLFGFNLDGAAAAYPKYSMNHEMRFVDGAPPNGLLEWHTNYTSIDRNTAFRPMMHTVDMNTHKTAWTFQNVEKFWWFDKTGNISMKYDGDAGGLTVPHLHGSSSDIGTVIVDGLYNRALLSGVLTTMSAIYGTFDGTTYADARITMGPYVAADIGSDVLTIKYGAIGVNTTNPLATIHAVKAGWTSTLVTNLRLTAPGIPGLTLEATNAAWTSNRNFAIVTNWASGGLLDILYSASQGTAPGAIAMEIDGADGSIRFPSLAGTGSRTVKADANGKLSAV